MNHSRTLKTIALIAGLSLALLGLGCSTNSNRVDSAAFGLTAEAVPEGIHLTFSNIPPETVRLFIHIQSWDGSGEAAGHHDIIASNADIVADSVRTAFPSFQLERIKQTGTVIFPVVQAGRNYRISASAETSVNDTFFQPLWAEAGVVAESGIYFNRNDISLALNDTKSAVTLLSEPVFTSEVTFHTQKYSFGVTIAAGEQRSIGVGCHHFPDGLSADGLTWTFQPRMTDNLRRDNSGWLESDKTYPAWVAAYVNIIHDGIVWSVEIAKTAEFDYSL